MTILMAPFVLHINVVRTEQIERGPAEVGNNAPIVWSVRVDLYRTQCELGIDEERAEAWNRTEESSPG